MIVSFDSIKGRGGEGNLNATKMLRQSHSVLDPESFLKEAKIGVRGNLERKYPCPFTID